MCVWLKKKKNNYKTPRGGLDQIASSHDFETVLIFLLNGLRCIFEAFLITV